MLLWEHRGWILRMASLYKGRLLWPSADCQMVQTIRPETCGASFQTSEGEHQHAFLYHHIEESTIPRQLLYSCIFIKWKKCNILPSFRLIHTVDSTFHRRPSVPLSLQRGKRATCFPVSQQGGIKDERSSWSARVAPQLSGRQIPSEFGYAP